MALSAIIVGSSPTRPTAIRRVLLEEFLTRQPE